MKNGIRPNTGEPVNGKTPFQTWYQYVKNKHICPECRTRWAEENTILCEHCAAVIRAREARRSRRKAAARDPRRNDLRRPKMADVVVVKELRSEKYVLEVNTDIGQRFTLRNLESVDLRDASQGRVKRTSFRNEMERKALQAIKNRDGKGRRKSA